MSPLPHSPDALLRRLEWTVIRKLDGLLHGNYRSLFRGFGLDLADIREYQLRDDVRHIDWNVTARMQAPYVREYTEDREVTAWFLLDLSPSIDFGSMEVKKRTVLTEFIGVLTRLLTRHGNRAGVLLYGGGVDTVIHPRSGREHVLHILNSLMNRPEMPNAPETDLSDFITTANQIIKRRSLVFLVSDFISTPGWAHPLARMARRHELVAVRLYDALEMDLPDLGLITMQDSETGEQIFVDTHDKGFRKRFAAMALARESELRGALASAGVDTLELSTTDDLIDAILRFADLRKRRSQQAAGGLPKHLEANLDVSVA